MTNIEKAAGRTGEYTGYGGGRVWRVRKVKPHRKPALWRADDLRGGAPDALPSIRAATLRALSDMLGTLVR